MGAPISLGAEIELTPAWEDATMGDCETPPAAKGGKSGREGVGGVKE